MVVELMLGLIPDNRPFDKSFKKNDDLSQHALLSGT